MPILRPRALALWFGDESKFWKLLTSLLGAFAVLRGIRQPGLWPLTHAELDYSFGFIKRGLLGSIYHTLHLWHARSLETAFFLELVFLFVLLIVLTLRSGLLEGQSGWYIAAAFASSYCITFLMNMIGFTDIPNAALAIAVLLVRDTRLRFLSALPVFVVAMLIHENFLLLFAPVVLFSFFLDGAFASPQTRRRAWAGGLILGILAVMIAIATSLKPHLSLAQVHLMQSQVSQRVDFPIREDVFAVLVMSLRQNLTTMWKIYTHSYWWWAEQLLSIFVLGPVLLVLILRCFRTLARANRGNVITKSAVILAVAAPLSMHLLGWDQVRWNVLCVLDAYLVLLIINARCGAAHIPESNAERNCVILVIALNMASGYGLLDFKLVRSYPFFPPAIKGIVARHDGIIAPL